MAEFSSTVAFQMCELCAQGFCGNCSVGGLFQVLLPKKKKKELYRCRRKSKLRAKQEEGGRGVGVEEEEKEEERVIANQDFVLHFSGWVTDFSGLRPNRPRGREVVAAATEALLWFLLLSTWQ